MNRHRRYRTHAAVTLYSESRPDSEQVGTIPADTELEALDKQQNWIRVNEGGKEGWATTALMDRLINPPAPDLEFHSNGYKVIDGKYRHFFGILNTGTADYTGDLVLRLYKDNAVIHSDVYTFADSPIPTLGGRPFHIDTDTKADLFEFVADDGTSNGLVGKFIEG